MRRLATLFPILLLASLLHAQAQQAYVIPDIGAPGMNTYVEIIGVWSTFSAFGPQDIEHDGPTPALVVEPANAADNARIVVGPATVHWEGRMISTQIFVKKGAAPGPCPIIVRLNGFAVTPQLPFEIITPLDLTLTNGQVLGTTARGTANWRSPRGAMIVRNLTLSGTITVNKADLDPTAPGIQGYLPLVLIAERTISMNGATIELSANNRDGGPGGGGGGGQVCDAAVFGGAGSAGSGGGNGYTGGSWGGRNNRGSVPVGNDIMQSNGTGTGGSILIGGNVTSSSLNGAPGGIPVDVCYPESAAGGTGHPFGDGGTAACGGAQTGPAGHGGGGGSANGTPGAGANHFGTPGAGGGRAGLRIGNAQCVPLAGGSGGSSGNPQGNNVCAGEGGGGGGAIALFSQVGMTGGTVVVRGGPGAGGVQGGGGGSGGMAIIGAKDWTATGGWLYSGGGIGGNSSVSPFTPGGVGAPGRLRFDGFAQTQPSLNETNSTFIGPTTDTLTWVDKPTFRLWGTYANTSHDIYVWIKGDQGITSWTRLAGPGAPRRVTSSGPRRWYLDITVPTGGNYYIVAAQQDPNTVPNDDRWERSARIVMSQAAANIITVDLIPKTNADTTIYLPDLVCESSITGSFRIINTGFAELVVQQPTFVPATDVQITSPTVWPQRIPGVVNEGDTNFIVVNYTFAPTTPGTKTTTITFTNNDPRIDPGPGPLGNPRNPLVVTIVGRKLAFNAAVSTPTLNLGEICVDSTSTRSLDFIWTGDTTARILAIEPMGSGPFSIVSPATPTPTAPRILANARVPITVRFRPTTTGTFTQQFRVVVDPCDTVFFSATGTAVRAQIAVDPQPIDFGQVAVGATASQSVTIENTGTSRGTIDTIYFVPPNPALTAPNVIGQGLPPGVSIPGQVTYAPTTTGAIAPGTRMCVVFAGVCPDTVCVPVSGVAITSLLRLSRTEIELRAEPCADPAPEEIDTLTLVNAGLAPETINSITALGGEVTFTTVPTIPTQLAGGDTILITIRWRPGTTGTETIRILTTSREPDQAQMDITVRRIRERSAITLLDSAGAAIVPPVDFGSLFGCDAGREIRFLVRSLGTMTEQVGARMVSGSAFTVNPGPGFTVGAGGEVTLVVRFETSGSGEFNDTLIVTNEICNVEYRVPVVGRRTGLSYSSAPIAFGQSNVGVGVAGSTFLRFDSTTTNDIRSVVREVFIRQTGSSFAVTRSSLKATLAPNELTTVEVTFTPAAQQTYTAELCWVVESPCLDTICVPLSGEGILANLVVTGSLDFGSHFVCEDSTLTLRIENTGNASVRINGITPPSGPDGAAFVPGTMPTFPVDLAPGDSIVVDYRFDPSLVATDGLKSSTVTVQSTDPNRPDITVRLVGERRRQAIQLPAAVDFGRVEVGTTSAPQTVVLYNRTDAPLRGRLAISGPYRIVYPTGPITVPPSPDSIHVVVVFTPVDSNDAPGALLVYYDEPCVDSTVIPITGRGRVTAIGSAALVIPDSLEGAPGDVVAIPIILERGSLLNEAEATTFRATLRFNRNLLYPIRVRSGNEAMPKPVTGMGVAAGSIISQTIEGDDRVVVIEVSNAPMPDAPDTIAWVDATVMLADRVTTPIAIDTLFFTDGQVLTVTDDGLFTLIGYCEVGANRLVRLTGAAGIKAVSPNPFNPSTEVLFETSESGPTTLQVLDARGRIVQRLVDAERLAVGAHARTWSAGDLPSGVYFVELRTPTERSIHRVVLVK